MMFRLIFQTCVLCLLLFIPVLVNASSFTASEPILNSTIRVNHRQSDFTYLAKVNSQDINECTGFTTDRSTDANTNILDDILNFGAIASGIQRISTDPFTLPQDRYFPFNPDSLVFVFKTKPENGNTKPVANSGIDQSVSINSLVTLDGSGSSDIDGDPLTYRWSFVNLPKGSTAFLANEDQSNPSFTVDKPGQYRIKLIVNDGHADSSPDQVVISTENSAPVAEAGPSQTAKVGSTVILDGSNLFDVDVPQTILSSRPKHHHRANPSLVTDCF